MHNQGCSPRWCLCTQKSFGEHPWLCICTSYAHEASEYRHYFKNGAEARWEHREYLIYSLEQCKGSLQFGHFQDVFHEVRISGCFRIILISCKNFIFKSILIVLTNIRPLLVLIVNVQPRMLTTMMFMHAENLWRASLVVHLHLVCT